MWGRAIARAKREAPKRRQFWAEGYGRYLRRKQEKGEAFTKGDWRKLDRIIELEEFNEDANPTSSHDDDDKMNPTNFASWIGSQVKDTLDDYFLEKPNSPAGGYTLNRGGMRIRGVLPR